MDADFHVVARVPGGCARGATRAPRRAAGRRSTRSTRRTRRGSAPSRASAVVARPVLRNSGEGAASSQNSGSPTRGEDAGADRAARGGRRDVTLHRVMQRLHHVLQLQIRLQISGQVGFSIG